jgi:hypothetical protein
MVVALMVTLFKNLNPFLVACLVLPAISGSAVSMAG